MGYENIVFIVVAVMVTIVWLCSASRAGFVESVTNKGFVIRSLLKYRIEIRWADIVEQAKMFHGFIPRIVVRVAGRKHRWLNKSYTVILRGRISETDFIELLESESGVRTVGFRGGPK